MDVLILDICVNEEQALFSHDYNMTISAEIFDFALAKCAEFKVLPIVLLMPSNFGINELSHAMRKQYIRLCELRGVPYFDVYTILNYTGDYGHLFQDPSHIKPRYAQIVGAKLAEVLLYIVDKVSVSYYIAKIYKFSHIDLIKNSKTFVNTCSRKTSLLENKFACLVNNDEVEVSIPNNVLVVGILFNMSQSNAVLEIVSGEHVNRKMLGSVYFDPNIALRLVIWNLFKPVNVKNGVVKFKCLSYADLKNSIGIELHGHGKYNEDRYADEYPRLEIAGFSIRDNFTSEVLLSKVNNINLDLCLISKSFPSMKEQIDEDFGLNDVAFTGVASQSSLSKWSQKNDAYRLVDSNLLVMDFAFHTNEEDNPWWRLDLGIVIPVQMVVIHNRIKMLHGKAKTLKVEVSKDGICWITLHAGLSYFGFGRDALKIPLNNEISFRLIKLSLTERNYFHLSKLEILVN